MTADITDTDRDDPLLVQPEPTGSRHRRRRRLTWIAIGGGVLVALVAFVLVYFQPQKLFLDDEVNEELPGFVATTGPATTGTEPSAGAAAPPAPPADPLAVAAVEAARTGAPVAVTSGAFASLDHPTSGAAFVVVQPDGSRLLRIEDLDTDNGPDLRVVLSTAAVGTGDYGQLVELGALKGNIGDQNYEIPADLDLTTIGSVVIWCERFSAPFGEAPAVLGT
jgi:hypothetical protein